MMFANKNVNVSFIFILIGIVSFIFADLSISTLHPFLETSRFFGSILDINFKNADYIVEALLNTITIAIIAILLIFTLGFRITPFPIFAPKILRSILFSELGKGRGVLRNNIFTTYHRPLLAIEPGWYGLLSNVSSSVFFISTSGLVRCF